MDGFGLRKFEKEPSRDLSASSIRNFLIYTYRTNALSFYRSQNVLGWSKFFCARPKIYLHIVVVTNILCQTKSWFAFSKIVFWSGTKLFEEALNAVKFLGWLKKFGLAQNILGPVKGQGISKVKAKSLELRFWFENSPWCLVKCF